MKGRKLIHFFCGIAFSSAIVFLIVSFVSPHVSRASETQVLTTSLHKIYTSTLGDTASIISSLFDLFSTEPPPPEPTPEPEFTSSFTPEPQVTTVTNTTTTVSPRTTIVERVVVERTPVTIIGVSKEFLEARLAELSTKFSAQIANATFSSQPSFSSFPNIVYQPQIQAFSNSVALNSALRHFTITESVFDRGTITNSSFSGSTGSFSGDVGVNGTLSASTLTVSGGTTLATTTISTLTVASSTITNLITGNATSTNIFSTNLVSTNASTTNLLTRNSTSTNATTTSFFAQGLTAITAFFTDLVTSTLNATNATSTNATSTNQFATNLNAINSNSTNLLSTNSTSTNATSTNLFATNLNSTNSSSTNLITINSTSTNATTTTLFASTITGSTTTFSGLATVGNLLSTGSSTLQNITFVNATGTSATTTNLYTQTLTALTAFFTDFFITNFTATNSTTTNATTTNLAVTGTASTSNLVISNSLTSNSTATSSFAGGLGLSSGGLQISTGGIQVNPFTSCDIKTNALGQFFCGMDAGGIGVETNWNFFEGSGIRLNTSSTTNQVLIGALGTTSLAHLEVIPTGSNPAAYFGGNVGIGTTSPFAKLSVVGETVSTYFTATSTTATSTFRGTVLIGSGSGLNSTTSSRAALEVVGGVTTLNNNIFRLTHNNGTGVGSGASVEFWGQDNSSEIIEMSRIGTLLREGSVGISAADLEFRTRNAGILGERMRLSAAGNLGIGTTSPYAKLSVVGETVSTFFTATSTTATSTFMGAVGIGTTTPSAQLALSGLLYVGGSGTSTIQNNLNVMGQLKVGTGSIFLNGAATSTFTQSLDISGGCYAVNGTCLVSGSTAVGAGTTGQLPYYAGAGNVLTATSSIFLATSGNVGIGTVSPSALLTITKAGDGTAKFHYSASTTVAGIDYRFDSVTDPGFMIETNAGGEGSGLFFNDDSAQLWSTGGSIETSGGIIDNAMFVLWDEDKLSSLTAKPEFIFTQNAQLRVGNKISLNSSPEFTITLGGGLSTQSIGVERETATVGDELVIQAGGSFSGGTNLAGGTLTLSGGISSGNQGSEIQFRTASIGSSGVLDNSPSVKMVLNSAGNLGIGTTSPYAKLSVVGEVVASNFTATTTSNNTFPNLLSTNSTSTNATSTSLFAATITGATATFSGTATVGNLLASGSSTLQNFTALNSTSTNATTTSFFTQTLNALTSLFTNLVSTTFTATNSTTTNLAVTGTASTSVLVVSNSLTSNSTATSTFAAGLILNGGGLQVATGGFRLNSLASCDTIDTDSSGNLRCGTDAGGIGIESNWNFFSGSGVRLGTTTNQVLIGASGTTSLAQLEVIPTGSNPAAYFAGNVGIGTTSPFAKLSIAGTSLGTTALFAISTSTASATSTAFIIDANGKVGIGTTSPSAQLALSGLLYVGGSGTSTIENNLNIRGQLQVGISSIYINDTSVRAGNGAFSLNTNATSTFENDLRINGNIFIDSNPVIRVDGALGSLNVSIGPNAGNGSITGTNNTLVGEDTGRALTSGQFNTFVGYQAGSQTAGSNSNSFFGLQAGNANVSGANNTYIGTQAGLGNISGSNNILLGFNAGSNLQAGSNNIIIGHNISGTSTTMTRGLNIGNLIFGTGLDGSGATLSTGNIGIGTTSPYAKLSVVGEVVASYFTATSTTATSTFANGLNVTGGCLSANGTCLVSGSTSVGAGTTGQLPYYAGAGNVLTATSSLFLSTTGNVGIGTTTPTEKLTVVGNIQNTYPASGLNPTLRASATTGTAPRSVYVSGPYAYVVNSTSNTLQIFDVATSSPALVGFANTNSTPFSVYVSGRYAYVANFGSDTLQIFDVSNPASPVVVGSVNTGTDPYSVYVSGRYAYVTNITSPTLRIFDVSNPSAPVSVGSVATGSNPLSVYVSGRYAYVVNNTGSPSLQIFDVSNPSAPVSVGSEATDGAPYSVYVSGRYAYVANETPNTLQVINISNPSAPDSVGSVPTGSSPSSVYVSGRYAYLTSFGSNTLRVIDVANPASPVAVGSVGTNSGPQSVYVSGRYAYVVNNGGSPSLQVFDISGIETTSAIVHSLEAGNLQVRNDLIIQGQGQFTGGLNVGSGGIFSAGALSVGSSSNPTAAFFHGNVGIGTTSPVFDANANAKYLTVSAGAIAGAIAEVGVAANQTNTTASVGGFSFVNEAISATDKRIASIFGRNDGATNSGAIAFFTSSAGTLNESMRISSTTNIGIGTTTPGNVKTYIQHNNTTLAVDRTGTDGDLILLRQDGVTEGTITVSGTTVSYNAFTGSHYAWTDESIDRGILVSLTGVNRNLRDNSQAEIIYGIALSTEPNDPKVLGSYLSVENPNEPANSTNPHLVMAVGNGDVWVVDMGSNLEPGDRLLSSQVSGHAMKDDGTYYPAYTVARVSEPLDWSTVTDTINDGGTPRKHKRITVLFENYRSSYSSQIQVDALGNVGIGTTSPDYKLHVMGDVAATSFVNISTKTSKKDITYLTEADNASVLEKIKNLTVASYHYTMEDVSSPLRIGLIAEEAPTEILSASGKGVDIYKLSTFILSGVKAQQKQIEELDSRVTRIESLLAISTSTLSASTSSPQATLSFLESLGMTITQGLVALKDLVAEKVTAALGVFDAVETYTIRINTGLEIKDQITGEMYCVTLKNGEWDKQKGICVQNPAFISTTPTPTPTVTPDPTTTPTPSPITEPTPTPDPVVTEPIPTPEVTPEPTPEATPEPTPEVTPEPTPEVIPVE